MGGLSFLMKKGWHPQTKENQKAVFMAEQAARLRQKQEEEAAKEVKKERELAQFEKAGDMGYRDPRSAELKFMYSMPSKKRKKEEEGGEDDQEEGREQGGSVPVPPKIFVPEGQEEDDDVVSFRSRLAKREALKAQPEVAEEKDISSKTPIGSDDQSKLNGYKRRNIGMSYEEQAARHPQLRGAPVEGEYARQSDVQLHHKPFCHNIRRVQCLRCGEWGHASGDRECPMANDNPHDWARQKREDPLSYMNGSMQDQKQKLILKDAALYKASAMTMGLSSNGVPIQRSSNGVNDQLITSEDEEDCGDSEDAEAAFLSSLSSKEKVLLLRRLEMIEASGDSVAAYASRIQQRKEETGHYCAEDFFDNISDSSSSSDSHRRHHKKKEHKSKDHHKDKKHKHKHKSSDKKKHRK